jgi:MtN3 and saliva related transmembrane protein
MLCRARAMGTEAIGWLSNLLLLMTMSKQVITQYKSGSTQGVSSWLFIGQLATSTGFVIYSYLLGNWVFVTSNVMLLFVALTGQYLYLRNKRRQLQAAPQDSSAATAVGRPGRVVSSGKA